MILNEKSKGCKISGNILFSGPINAKRKSFKYFGEIALVTYCNKISVHNIPRIIAFLNIQAFETISLKSGVAVAIVTARGVCACSVAVASVVFLVSLALVEIHAHFVVVGRETLVKLVFVDSDSPT